MRTRLLLISSAIVVLGFPTRAATEAQRRDHLDWMLKNLPDAPTWRAWQLKAGVLPPDFEALPSANFLPDPFQFHDGRAVSMPADWTARRAEIKELYQKHILGSLPPKPKLDRMVPVGESKANGYVTRVVRLEYGPERKITTPVTLTLPDGAGPFPVLIGGGSWSASLLRRGYAACEFPSSVDQATNLQELHSGFDFATVSFSAPRDHSGQPSLTLWAVWAQEIRPPTGQEPIRWCLLTTVPVQTLAEGIERIAW